MNRSTRIVTGLLAGAAITVFVAGCGGGSHPTASVGNSSAATATQPPATGSASTPETPRANAASGAVPRCGTGDLAAALGTTNGAAGHILDVFTLSNTSTRECYLYGYPGLGLLSASGATLPSKTVRGSDMAFPAVAPRVVDVAPHGVASFSVGYSDVPSGSASCPSAAALEITPPDDVAHLVVHVSLQPCDGGRLDVSPVVSGANGVQNQ